MRFSIIIPTFNEEKKIHDQTHDIRGKIEAEIIVVDGGSTDNTKETVSKEEVIFVSSGKGRGIQCANVAKAASGDYLIFLHADTRLPALSLIHI